MKHLYVQVRLLAAESDDEGDLADGEVLDETHVAAKLRSTTAAMYERLSGEIEALYDSENPA